MRPGTVPCRRGVLGRIVVTTAALVAAASAVVSPASQSPAPPRVVRGAAAACPDSLRGLRLGGWVMVQIQVDSSGEVAGAKVTDHPASVYFFGPHARAFEEAALAAARGYRFEPGPGESTAAGVWATRVWFDPPLDTAASGARPRAGALTGEVRDAVRGWRLSGVGVCVAALRRTTLTTAGGYLLEGLPPGRHEVAFSATGYVPVRRALTIRASVTDTFDLVLRPCEDCVRERCFGIPRGTAR